MMNAKMKVVLLSLSICQIYSEVQSARILLIPGPHYSHVNLFSNAGRAIQDDGHKVYVLTMIKFGSTVKKHGLVPLLHNDTKSNDIQAKAEEFARRTIRGSSNTLDIFTIILPIISDWCKDVNRNQPLMDKIRDLEFDLVINDATMFYTCFYTIPYRFGLRYMSLSAAHDPWTFGVSGLPSIEPSQLSRFSNRMSFSERMMNLVHFTLLFLNPLSLLYSSEHLGEFAPHRPYKSFRQLVSESEMTLVNHDVTCVGYPRVSAPNYQFIGGTSAKKAEPLSDELQEFVDGAMQGIIILSLGSRKELHLFWKDLKPIMMNVLSRLPQRAIVHYAFDDIDDAPKNVKLVKWLPQNDLLGLQNTKVFITHGGNNGQLEAVYHGVPVLTIPLTGDQKFNAIQAHSRGFGLMIEMKDMNEPDLYDALTELINNKTYSESIKKCSHIMKSMPSSQEMTVFWVNHILRYGSEHLQLSSLEMPIYQILMLDIFAFLALVLIFVWVLITCVCCYLCKICRRSPKQKSD